jgi:hypothetical protein
MEGTQMTSRTATLIHRHAMKREIVVEIVIVNGTAVTRAA